MKKAALILNGDTFTRKKIAEDYIVCADNGYRMCKELGIVPDVIVGDMDSIEEKLENIPDTVEKLRFPSKKDETDGELAMNILISRGYNRVNVYGADGGRLDHIIGNISLVYAAAQMGCRAVLKTNLCDMYLVNGYFEHSAQIGDKISIVPYNGDAHIIKTEGLEYPVEDRVLKAGTTLGISNVAIAENVVVSVGSGYALVFRTFN